MFTDIHWGAKNNSVQHNNDCTNYVDWFIEKFKADKCDIIVFMGDWFENRNSINVGTLNASFNGLKKLDSLGVPIYFCIGNHDLYHRSNREEYSTYHFSQFKNVHLISEPTQIDHMLFFPYLFKEEYADAAAMINKVKPTYVFGHFEFRNFVITGTDRKMDHGPDHTLFAGPTFIFSGHFHKRQVRDNVVYIGNTFPTNYGDAGDDERGMAILDDSNDYVHFNNWVEAPTYRKIKLSSVLDGSATFPPKCRVRCVIDVDIVYSEAQALKEEMMTAGELREFVLEENAFEKNEAIAGEDNIDTFDLSSLNEAVVKMLETGVSGTTTIDASRLIQIYNQL